MELLTSLLLISVLFWLPAMFIMNRKTGHEIRQLRRFAMRQRHELNEVYLQKVELLEMQQLIEAGFDTATGVIETGHQIFRQISQVFSATFGNKENSYQKNLTRQQKARRSAELYEKIRKTNQKISIVTKTVLKQYHDMKLEGVTKHLPAKKQDNFQ